MTNGSLACTCPHPVYSQSSYKHTAVAKNATNDGTLETFSSDDNDDERVSGPYTGYDKYGTVDHTYWTCEDCGAEATWKGALTDCY
ncbi:hypothetical protein ACFFQF_23035 [Haladaptatus pallidirubidus]|uniref:DUF8118 domain-containing protein n=1 Tax=Haladaptatus pallidirubidus TaxID=1008152 RepID=A0AAV3UNZ9_9EURY|nr:hypothetical protein [Haladaptatus pallidirubidus]